MADQFAHVLAGRAEASRGNLFVDKLLQVVPNEGGSLEKVDIWGKRRLAYDIKKNSEGIYLVVNMKATSQTAQELDRQLGLNEAVLRTKLLRAEA